MQRSSTLFLQVVTVALGLGVLAFMLWEPHLEGRNVNATLFEIYFKDPFLAYVYVSSSAFFVALYQVFKVLGYVRHNEAFSPATVRALRTIKQCALALVVLIATPLAYLVIARPEDDIAGGVAMALGLIFISLVVSATAAMFESAVQSAAD